MIRQDDGRMKVEIRQWGCYFMSILFWLNKLTNISLSADCITDGIYKLFVKRQWMRETCFILNPLAILDWGGIECTVVTENGSHRLPPNYQCRKNDIEILFFKRPGHQGHFVAGDGKGNVAYDPMGRSVSVKDGDLISKRVFRPK